jgi:hypothetical protein
MIVSLETQCRTSRERRTVQVSTENTIDVIHILLRVAFGICPYERMNMRLTEQDLALYRASNHEKFRSLSPHTRSNPQEQFMDLMLLEGIATPLHSSPLFVVIDNTSTSHHPPTARDWSVRELVWGVSRNLLSPTVSNMSSLSPLSSRDRSPSAEAPQRGSLKDSLEDSHAEPHATSMCDCREIDFSLPSSWTTQHIPPKNNPHRNNSVSSIRTAEYDYVPNNPQEIIENLLCEAQGPIGIPWSIHMTIDHIKNWLRPKGM